MNNKKNFRIKKSTKLDNLVNQNPLLQKTLQKIVGGRTKQENAAYGRLAGYMQELV
jgi:hypothetical protein